MKTFEILGVKDEGPCPFGDRKPRPLFVVKSASLGTIEVCAEHLMVLVKQAQQNGDASQAG